MRRILITAGAALAAVIGLALPAGATTLTCTNIAGATSGPIGCGGLQSVFTGHGTQDISAQGNFSNAKIITAADTLGTNSAEDFTVYTVPGHEGQGSLGEYVAMFTPLGKIPGAPAGDFAPADGNHALEFCISVQNQVTRVGGKLVQRWFAVLRNCWLGGTSFTGPDGAAPGTVTDPNTYEVWEPVVGNGNGLELVNKALLTSAGRHGIGPNTNYVLDIKANGGPGTQLIAYPEHNSPPNELWTVLGCTAPVSVLDGGTFSSCP